MLDWLGKMLDLPKEFLACNGGKGGGVIQVRGHASYKRCVSKRSGHRDGNYSREVVIENVISLLAGDCERGYFGCVTRSEGQEDKAS
jgi:hypothetical protein